MWFQLRFTANVAWMSTGVMTVQWGGPLNITVTLHSDEQGSEEEELKKVEGLSCRALAQFEPSPEIQRIFQELQKGAQGKDLADDWYWELKELPTFFQSFIWDIQEQLLRPADKVIRLLRWRFDLTGSRQVSSNQNFEWSLDGNSWWPAPYDLTSIFDYAEAINPSPNLGEASTDEKLSDLLAAGLDEPAGHAIVREAWSLRNRSPSTSLILGMTAVEIGVKQCIAILSYPILSPDTAWLVQEVQTPVVEKMLEEYVPKLPLKNKPGKGVPALPKNLKTEMVDGRRIRNTLIHNPAAPPPPAEKVRKVLLVVKDILWLCDYYCGLKWAASHMRNETRKLYFPRGWDSI